MWSLLAAVLIACLGAIFVWSAWVAASINPRRPRLWDYPVATFGGGSMAIGGLGYLAARLAGVVGSAGLLIVTILALGSTPALAADGGGVVVPWGQWVTDGLGYALEIAGLWLVWALRAWIPDTLRQYIVNEVLKNATHFAVAVTPGAVAGQSVSLPQTTSLVANFESYVIQNAPGIARWLGDTLRTKAIARLSAAGMLPADFDPAKV